MPEENPGPPPGFGNPSGSGSGNNEAPSSIRTTLRPTQRQVEAIKPLLREVLRRATLGEVQTQLNFDGESEEVDEEIEAEAPPVRQSEPRIQQRSVPTNATQAVMPHIAGNGAGTTVPEQPSQLPPLAAAYVQQTGQTYNPIYHGYTSVPQVQYTQAPQPQMQGYQYGPYVATPNTQYINPISQSNAQYVTPTQQYNTPTPNFTQVSPPQPRLSTQNTLPSYWQTPGIRQEQVVPQYSMAVPTMNPQWAPNEKDMVVQTEPGPFI
uniref:extensin-2-like n=1 Tax=Erigeron canadensis TaxID=72917 RepID=UPI001CB97183|nr:extensin-2-like [Erigeron canadensis]